MTVPEIIGSIRSTYTRTACMVCEEKGIEYLLTERPLHAPEIRGHPSLRQNAGAAPRRCRTVRIEGHRHLSRSQLPGSVRLPLRSSPRRPHRAMGLARQHGDRPHPHPDLSLRLYRRPDRRWNARPGGDRRRHAGGARADRGSWTRRSPGPAISSASSSPSPTSTCCRSSIEFGQAPEGAEALAAAPHLSRYYQRHAARPSFKKTIPPAGPPGRAKPR